MSNFSGLGLSQSTLKAVESLGFETPTLIQSKAIPRLLESNRDFIGLAQTGTGKTAAFGLPLVDLVDPESPVTQALVLTPTRELCLQVAEQLSQFGQYSNSLNIIAVYGGTDISRQIRSLKKGCQILIATPGRLKDLLRRKAANLEQLAYLVLDEADEMLNMGFRVEIDEILEETPEDKHTWLFSATMSSDIRQISKRYMSNPDTLVIGAENASNKNIDHRYTFVRPSERYHVFKGFLTLEEQHYGIIFCRTRRETKELAERLNQDGFYTDAIHGDLNQVQRDRVMDKFRSKRIKLLVATDVAARGIDVQDISHVYHYNIPEDLNVYTHRSGRTGRAGNKGVSLIFAHPKDKSIIHRLERRLKANFDYQKAPSEKEIMEQRMISFVQKIKEAPLPEGLNGSFEAVQGLLEDVTKDDLIKKVLSLKLGRNLGKSSRQNRDRVSRNHAISERSSGGRFHGKRLFINLGIVDLESKSRLLAFICDRSQVNGQDIGKISINDKHSFFEVRESIASQVIQQLNNSSFQGRKIRVNEDRAPNGRSRSKQR